MDNGKNKVKIFTQDGELYLKQADRTVRIGPWREADTILLRCFGLIDEYGMLTMKAGGLYEIDCELVFEKRWTCHTCGADTENGVNICQIERCDGYEETVAILKPLREKAETQDTELYNAIRKAKYDFLNDEGSKTEIQFIIDTLKSKYTITRNP